MVPDVDDFMTINRILIVKRTPIFSHYYTGGGGKPTFDFATICQTLHEIEKIPKFN